MEGKIKIGLALVLVTMFWASASAQSGCSNVIISMSPCLDYITGNSSKPSSDCCTQLASVVRSSPECLCEVLNGGGESMGIKINRTLAIALPGACKVETPPLNRCDASSPSDSPAGSPESSNTGNGSKDTPSTENGSSDGSSIKFSSPLLFFALFAATYASTFFTT